MDNEIRIKPTLVGTDLDTFNEKLSVAEQHMQRILQYSSKITIPGVSGGSSSAGGGVGTGGGSHPGASGGGGGTNASERATQYVQERMPPRARRTHGRSGAGNASMNSGQFLTNFDNIIQPILPQLDAMMQQPGGKANATSALRQHLSHVQRIAAQPAGSSAESQAILAANQASGIDPAALAAAATQYRATNPTHGAVISAYLQAQQQAAGGGGNAGGGSGTGATGILQRLTSAAGYGELGGLMGTTAAGTALGATALGIGFVANQTRQGWSNYMAQGTAFSALSKTVGTLGESFNTLRSRVDATSLGLAESLGTITAATQAIVPYTGNMGTGGLTRMMTASQGLAFSMGLNPVSTAQAFGQAAQVGILGTSGSPGSMTPAQWAALIGNATAAGSMQGRQGQVLSSMLSVSQQIAQQIAGAPNQTLLASIMTGLNQSGNPLLQGAMGAQLLGSINKGIQNPGLGNAGALASYQALNPNGRLGYFQEKFLQAQGLTGRNPITGVSNFAAELGYFQKMLPGGKVHFTKGRYGSMPTEQTASVSALLGQMWGITQPQALAVLKSFNGQSLSMVNRTAQLAQTWGGPNALQHLLSHGRMNVFSEIANAHSVSGRYGLNQLAHEVTGSLHGHVSHQFYQLEKQYQHLGPGHAHQRATLFAHMQRVLGQSALNGPTLQTSIDRLNSTMAKATAAWVRIAKDLEPAGNYLANASKNVANNLAPIVKHPLSLRAWGNFLFPGQASGSVDAALTPYLGAAQAHAGMHRSLSSYNPTVRRLLQQTGASRKITVPLVDAIMQTQDATGNPWAAYVDNPHSMDVGLMGINSMNWKSQGIAQNPFNVTGNLRAGINILRQDLAASHGNMLEALTRYAGTGHQAHQDAVEMLVVMHKIEKHLRNAANHAVAH